MAERWTVADFQCPNCGDDAFDRGIGASYQCDERETCECGAVLQVEFDESRDVPIVRVKWVNERGGAMSEEKDRERARAILDSLVTGGGAFFDADRARATNMDRIASALRAVREEATRETMRVINEGKQEERVRLVQEFGDCCQGSDPMCMGAEGCLLIVRMNRRSRATTTSPTEPAHD